MTIRRFEEDSVFIPVMKSLRQGSEITAQLLKEFSDRVSVPLLRKSGMWIRPEKNYTLRHYKELRRPQALSKGIAKVNRVKTGIRVVVEDILEYGPVHTLHVIAEKLSK